MSDPSSRLPWQTKVGWAVGELGVAVYVGSTMSFFLFYMTEAHGISPAWAGLALLVPRIWDGITDPIMGAISDRTSSRFGRRRVYLLAGSLLYGAGFWLFLAVPSVDDEVTALIYLVGAYMIASTTVTIFDVPYSSMVAEMTTDYRERVSLAGYKMVAARIGILIAGGAGPMIFSSGENLIEGFFVMGAVFGGFMTLTGLFAFWGTQAAPRIERTVSGSSLKDELAAITRNRPFRALFNAFLLQNVAIGASATMLVYFLTYAMRIDASFIGPLLLTSGIVATLVTPLWVRIGRKMEKRTAYTVGLAITATMALPGLFLPPELFWLLFFVYALAAVGDAANQLFPTSMAPDTVEADEVNTGQRREGAIFGALAFCRKLGMAFGAFFASLILSTTGFIEGGVPIDQQPAFAVEGVRWAYSLLPFTLWIGVLLLIQRYGLDEREFENVKARIASRPEEPSAGAEQS